MFQRRVSIAVLLAFGVAGIGLGGCGAASGTAAIRATPAVGLYDRSRTIVVSGLRPRAIVRVTAISPGTGGTWSASAIFRANVRGVVDLAREAPLSGSYSGVSVMGLFWSERRSGRGSAVSNEKTVTTLTVSAGSRRLASVRVTQLLVGPGVSEHAERIGKVGFYGEYFSPAGSRRGPAVVLWGGSEGGLSTAPEAALLASHGIPALALAYFDEPGLPCSLSGIPLEYFVRAVRWLRSQPRVDPRRVWVMGDSRGSEAALLLAADWGDLVHGVIASAPSSEVYGSTGGACAPAGAAAWTLRGRPLPYAPTVTADAVEHADGSVSEAPAFLAGLANSGAARAARIPVWRIKGPVLLISGGDDQLWPSDTYADRIMVSLRHDPSPHVHLNYPAAGHLVAGIPYVPGPTEYSANGGMLLALGGSLKANNAASRRNWPETISFIIKH